MRLAAFWVERRYAARGLRGLDKIQARLGVEI
jgi:hypothetical protein